MAEAAAEKIQVVDGDGLFQTEQVTGFVAENKLVEMKTDYQVVAIMGPQSSGKSTLMNHVFGTTFVMMDAMTGRSQTTKGIWLSRAPKLADKVTLVMDLEGNDGRERGEDDTNFERQTALFALAVADILMVNIWCHDIGREQGSGKPLLKTIFQVNLKLFAPEPNRRKTVLLFVIRDKTKTPLNKLVEVLEQDLNKMWDTISKPPQYKESKITDFFEVQYTALPSYEEKNEDFVADAVRLRRRFSPDDEDTLVRQDDKLPGAAFAFSIGKLWEVIRSQKDLNLPAHKIMVANTRCNEIKEDQLRAFAADQAWAGVQAKAQEGLVEGLGQQLAELIDSCVKGYEVEAMYFDAKVRSEKQAELLAKLHELVQPLYQEQVGLAQRLGLAEFERELKLALADGKVVFTEAVEACRSEALSKFDHALHGSILVPGSPWDGKAEAKGFVDAVDAHIKKVRSAKIQEAMHKVEKQMRQLLSGPVVSLLDSCPPSMWPRLHAVGKDAVASSERQLLKLLDGFSLSQFEASSLACELQASGRARLEDHVREAALTRLSRMKDRFTEVFQYDENRTPRMWTVKDNIPAVAREARLAAANVLAQLAVIRPADSSASGEDAVSSAVLRLARSDLADPGSSGQLAAEDGGDDGVLDVQSAATWPGVDPESVLLQPHEVRTSWREFISSSNAAVQQALSAQQANKLAHNRPPPLWALGAILLLGWNEFMAIVFNPVYLVVGVLGFLFFRTLYSELDVDSEMQRGTLPGALSIANKFMPALRNVVGKTLESLQSFAASMQEQQQQQGPAQPARSYEAAGQERAARQQARAATELTQRRRPEAEQAGGASQAPPAAPAAGGSESRKDQ